MNIEYSFVLHPVSLNSIRSLMSGAELKIRPALPSIVIFVVLVLMFALYPFAERASSTPVLYVAVTLFASISVSCME